MMNENVKKAYEEISDVVNLLRYSDEDGISAINHYMNKMVDCVTPLLNEGEYAYYAKTLLRYISEYHEQKVEKFYIIEYASKLCELIKETNKPKASEEVKVMYENAKTICDDVASAIQLGMKVTQQKLKDEGPQYVEKARSTVKDVTQKIKSEVRNWLNEDDSKD